MKIADRGEVAGSLKKRKTEEEQGQQSHQWQIAPKKGPSLLCSPDCSGGQAGGHQFCPRAGGPPEEETCWGSAPTRRRNNHDVWTSEEEEEERRRPGRARDGDCVWMVGSLVGFQFPVGWHPARLRQRSSAASSNLTASGTRTAKRRKKEKDRPNIPCRFFFEEGDGACGCKKGEVCEYSHNRERFERFRRAQHSST